MTHLKTRQVAIVVALLASNSSYGVTPRVHTIVNKGTVFEHFEVVLSKKNLLLPREVKNRERLDETTDNFKYGQFEVFIPTRLLTLPLNCKGNYIVRMPQTLDEDKAAIKRKQALYYTIRDARTSGEGAVRVVLAMVDNEGYACNLFFRDDRRGRYVDYVGKLRS